MRFRQAIRSPSADRRASPPGYRRGGCGSRRRSRCSRIRRIIGRGGERLPGGAPAVNATLHQRGRPVGHLRDIGGDQRPDFGIVGEDEIAPGAQHALRQAIETRTDRPRRTLGMALAILATRHDRDRGGVALVDRMRRLGRPDRRHVREYGCRRTADLGRLADETPAVPIAGSSSTTTSHPICFSQCAVSEWLFSGVERRFPRRIRPAVARPSSAESDRL